MSEPPEVHTFRTVWFRNLEGGRQKGLACSCWRQPGDRCPELEKFLASGQAPPLMAALAAICPLPRPQELNSDEGGPHAD
mgnify:CR=1 FL=1